MTADSLCKIVRFVRQNAEEKPELWPFLNILTKNPVILPSGFSLIIPYSEKYPERVGIDSYKGRFDELYTGEILTTRFQTRKGSLVNGKNISKNSVIIDPSKVSVMINSPGYDKRSMYVGAINPPFELPEDHPTKMNETIVEILCYMYIPTPVEDYFSPDPFFKYRAANVDYVKTHLAKLEDRINKLEAKL